MADINSVHTDNFWASKDAVEEVLAGQIGKKLPKKVRKKLKWKKVTPVLSIVLAALLQVIKLFAGSNKPASKTAPAPAPGQQQTETRPSAPPRTAKTTLRSPVLQGHVEQAQAYQAEINQLTQHASTAFDGDRSRELTAQVEQWTAAIVRLAGRVDAFQQNKLVNRDLKGVPKAIASLQERLAQTTDPQLAAELERTLSHRRNQLSSLQEVQRTIQWAEIKIESTLSLLGTVYSQVLAGQSKN